MKSINKKQIKEIEKEIKELKEKQDDLSSEVEGLEDELDQKRDELENLEFKIELLDEKADELKYIYKFFKASANEQKTMAIDKISENRYAKGQFKIGDKWYITNSYTVCCFGERLGGVEDISERLGFYGKVHQLFDYPKTEIEFKTSQISQLEPLRNQANMPVKVGEAYVNMMYLHYVSAALDLDDTAKWYTFTAHTVPCLLVEQGENSAVIMGLILVEEQEE